MVFVLLHNVFFSLGIYNDTFAFNGHTMHEYTLQETLRGLFDGVFMRKTERLLGGFWFLKSLFYGNIFFFVTRKFVPKLWCGALLLLCATVLSSYLHLKIPFLHINSRDCFAAFFIMIGHIARNTNINGNKLSNLIITNKNVIAFFIMSIGLGSIYWPTSMLNYQWYHIIPYATTAIMGTFVIYSIGHYINVNHHGLFRDFLIYTGGYTFNVLTWHFLSFKLVSYLIIVIYGLPYSDLADFPIIDDKAKMGWWLAYVTIGVMLPLSCKYASTMILQKVK